MKSFFKFLFSYGELGWKTRLSRQDHLYHQGRNVLAALLFTLPFLAVMGYMLVTRLGNQTALTNPLVDWALIGLLLVLVVPMIYLGVMALKLTILRLHDFNRSGWYVLVLILLGMLDGAFSHILPAFESFVSLQNLAYLALLVVPASAVANRFGTPEVNSTEGKPRWIRAVPLVAVIGMWLLGMGIAFAELHAAKQQAEISRQQMQEMEKILDRLNAENALPATVVSPTQPISVTIPVSKTIQ